MRKALIGAASSAALGAALIGVGPAEANPVVLIPWLIVAGAGGIGVGAVAASQSHPNAVVATTDTGAPTPGVAAGGYGTAYGPDAAPPGAPTAAGVCHIAQAPTPNGGLRSVEVCD